MSWVLEVSVEAFGFLIRKIKQKDKAEIASLEFLEQSEALPLP